MFLFQIGTIKRLLIWESFATPLSGFYSKLVRLKGESDATASINRGKVSIPNWYD